MEVLLAMDDDGSTADYYDLIRIFLCVAYLRC